MEFRVEGLPMFNSYLLVIGYYLVLASCNLVIFWFLYLGSWLLLEGLFLQKIFLSFRFI